jgi:hypothetical protein
MSPFLVLAHLPLISDWGLSLARFALYTMWCRAFVRVRASLPRPRSGPAGREDSEKSLSFSGVIPHAEKENILSKP